MNCTRECLCCTVGYDCKCPAQRAHTTNLCQPVLLLAAKALLVPTCAGDIQKPCMSPACSCPCIHAGLAYVVPQQQAAAHWTHLAALVLCYRGHLWHHGRCIVAADLVRARTAGPCPHILGVQEQSHSTSACLHTAAQAHGFVGTDPASLLPAASCAACGIHYTSAHVLNMRATNLVTMLHTGRNTECLLLHTSNRLSPC